MLQTMQYCLQIINSKDTNRQQSVTIKQRQKKETKNLVLLYVSRGTKTAAYKQVMNKSKTKGQVIHGEITALW